MTPLHKACSESFRGEEEQASQIVLDLGANVNDQDHDGNTPLHLACSNIICAPADVVAILMDKGASITLTNRIGETPIMASVSPADDASKISILIKRGACSNPNIACRVLLEIVRNVPKYVEEAWIDVVKNLLELGASSSFKSRGSQTILALAKAQELNRIEKVLKLHPPTVDDTPKVRRKK